MENEAKKTYEVIITTTFRYRTTVEASSKREAEDIATREIVEDSDIDVLDTDDIDTDVSSRLIEPQGPILPDSVTFGAGELGLGEGASPEEAEESISNLLSDRYGYCHFGFAYERDGDSYRVTDIKWDVDGEETDDE
jgi:hypothetical protein